MKKIFARPPHSAKRAEKRALFCYFAAIFLLVCGIVAASKLLEPKCVEKNREGRLVADYYLETDAKNTHDVIFVGDCETYSGIIPAKLWESARITSFVRGTPGQTVEQSYYLISEMLDYERPRAIFLGVYGATHRETERETYNRMTFDKMRMSRHKISGVIGCKRKEESLISYIFPVLRFHARWRSLSREDFRYLSEAPPVSHNGYLLRKETIAGEFREKGGEPDAPIPKESLDIIREICELCKNKGVELVLIKMPTDSWRYPWYDEWEEQISALAAEKGIRYYNLIGKVDGMGIDMSRDSYDGGLHLNCFGAEKATAYIAEILVNDLGLGERKKSSHTHAVWEEKLIKYYEEKGAGQNES